MHCTDKYSTQLSRLANLAKWLSVPLQTKWLWVRVPLQSLKRLKAQNYYLPKSIIKNYNVIINAKNYDQPIDSDIKQSKEITKLATRQSEKYTTGCMLDY